MADGFDMAISCDGELLVDEESHDIKCLMDDNMRLQLAYDRIKSISTNWFIDEVGADLESLIGSPCNADTAEKGKILIESVINYDGLWAQKDLYIMATISDNNKSIVYSVYLLTYQSDDEATVITNEITVELDLVKGVKIRYGWDPRR